MMIQSRGLLSRPVNTVCSNGHRRPLPSRQNHLKVHTDSSWRASLQSLRSLEAESRPVVTMQGPLQGRRLVTGTADDSSEPLSVTLEAICKILTWKPHTAIA